MEIEEIKIMWKKHDQKLDANLKFNKQLLKKMNLDKSKQEMQKPMLYEITSIFIMFLVSAYLISSSIQVINELQYSIPGFIATILSLIYLTLSVIKTNDFLKIDYFSSPIIQLQKELAKIKVRILRFRKIEFTLLPIFVISILPILFKPVLNMNIYADLKLLSIVILIILGISIPVTIWINKNLYDKKMRNTERFLSEIDTFETE